jgi:hypothetical protein
MYIPRENVLPPQVLDFLSSLPYADGARLRLRLVNEVGVEIELIGNMPKLVLH